MGNGNNMILEIIQRVNVVGDTYSCGGTVQRVSDYLHIGACLLVVATARVNIPYGRHNDLFLVPARYAAVSQ